MVTFQLFDQLLQFPLFLGMSRDDLHLVAGHTKFDFQKVEADKVFIRADSVCNQLSFLLSGTVTASAQADDGSYTFCEQLSAPLMLQPEALFGYHQRYTHSFRTDSTSNLLTIDRQEIVRLTEQFLVFRINLLNLLATQAQKLLHQPWRQSPNSLQGRIVRFIAQHCLYPAGYKNLYILMSRLADEIGDSRLDISRSLNSMQRQGLIILHRGRIEIPQMERLLM
jgi:CRP-like cAMP-binding protein